MKKIYLDNQSTTQLDPEIMELMIPYFLTKFGNSSSKTHSYGWEAEAAVDLSRKKISDLINSKPNEIIFTSGATESNNIALGTILKSTKTNILTCLTEHRAILDICNNYDEKGIKTKYLKISNDGNLNLNTIESNIDCNTHMISLMHVNNEIGTIHPIKKIGEICKKHNILFHVDAAQSLGKIPIDVREMNIDFMSFSSHKIYGPKGIGALFINNMHKNKISPISFGGGQENGYRPGTLPVPLIIGFGEACKKANSIMLNESKKIRGMRDILLNKIKNEIPNLIINGSMKNRLDGNLNLSFPSLKGQSIVTSIPIVAISSGSACTSSIPKPSHVLKAIGLNNNLCNSSIRIGIGRFNTLEEINVAADAIIKAIKMKS
tara:strand:- start:1568 stop:2698 length:1131 start_codon:yes stop_codon:yes gene_type:complete